MLAEDHNYPEQFLQEMAVQVQALATAYGPVEEHAEGPEFEMTYCIDGDRHNNWGEVWVPVVKK